MTINVAIVEDDQRTREGLKAMIDSSNELFCCGTFENNESFKNVFKHLDVHVVLMDIELKSETSGIDCVEELHKQREEVMFLMCTHLEDSDNVYAALKVGAKGYIVKNTTPEKMLAAIKELHAGGSPMSPQIARKVLETFEVRKAKSDKLELLNPLEMDTLRLLAKGYQYKEIADKESKSIDAIRSRIKKIYDKLEVNNRHDASLML